MLWWLGRKWFTRRRLSPLTHNHPQKAADHYAYKSLIYIEIGPPGAIRTHDLPLRRRLLYPAELQAGNFGSAELLP